MEIKQTDIYARWFRKFRDPQGKARINIALHKCKQAGEVVGDVKNVGDGINELRIHAGSGYRIYFMTKGDEITLLVVGGDKSSQHRDISKAKKISAEITREEKWQ